MILESSVWRVRPEGQRHTWGPTGSLPVVAPCLGLQFCGCSTPSSTLRRIEERWVPTEYGEDLVLCRADRGPVLGRNQRNAKREGVSAGTCSNQRGRPCGLRGAERRFSSQRLGIALNQSRFRFAQLLPRAQQHSTVNSAIPTGWACWLLSGDEEIEGWDLGERT